MTVAVLDEHRMREPSVTVLDALEDLDRELSQRGVELRLEGLPETAVVVARRTDWFQEREAAGRVTPTPTEAAGS